jgi:hypothetical protein
MRGDCTPSDIRAARSSFLAAVLVCSVASWAACAGAGKGVVAGQALLEESFEAEGKDAVPAGWRAAATGANGAPAIWIPVAAADAPHGKQVLRLRASAGEDTFNLLLSEKELPADLAVEVRLRADSGQLDRGGGFVWRTRDAKNYYVTRWNALESNLRAYKVEKDERMQLAHAEVRADAAAWHTLSVVAKGAKMTVSLDGKQLLELEDPTFAGAGAVGLWSKADASSSFDALRAGAAR